MRVALVASTPPRLPDGRARWVRLLVALARERVARGDVLLGSVSTLPYELALVSVLDGGGEAEVLLPNPAALVRLLELLPESLLGALTEHPALLPLMSASHPSARQRAWGGLVAHGLLRLHPQLCLLALPLSSPGERDRCLLERAEQVVAIRIRPEGSLLPRLEARARAGWPVQVVSPWLLDEAQDTPSRGSAEPAPKLVHGHERLLKLGLPSLTSCWVDLPSLPELKPAPARLAFGGQLPLDWAQAPLRGPTLTHFTRACCGPWPGESPREYLRSLLRGDEGPRTAAASLEAHPPGGLLTRQQGTGPRCDPCGMLDSQRAGAAGRTTSLPPPPPALGF